MGGGSTNVKDLVSNFFSGGGGTKYSYPHTSYAKKKVENDTRESNVLNGNVITSL